MPSNVRQLLENGTPIYPITERSLVIGLQDAPFEYYVLAWDGASTPVVSKIPAGVVVTYNNTNYTGTLAASATTAPYLYLVASTTQAGEYDRYIVTNNGNNTFSWTPVGSTAPVTPVIVDNLTTNDATKALSAKQGKVLKDELSQFEAKLNGVAPSEVEQSPTYTPCRYMTVDGAMSALITGTTYAYCDPISIADVTSIKVKGILNAASFGGIYFANNATIPTSSTQAKLRVVQGYYHTTSTAGNVNEEMTFNKTQLDALRALGATHIYVGVYQAGAKEMVFGYDGSTGLIDDFDALEDRVDIIDGDVTKLKQDISKDEAVLRDNVGIKFDLVGYYNESGEFVSASSFRCTKKINLTGVTKLKAIYTYGVAAAPNVCYFDSDGAFISAATWNSRLYKELTTADFPAGAAYATFSTLQAYLGDALVILNETYSINNRIQQLVSWENRTGVCYGDSITAQGNDGVSGYVGILNREISFLNLYGRGVGGQSYIWNDSAWYTEVGTKGAYLDRYLYDENGNKLTSVISVNYTQEQVDNIENALGKTIEVHRGCFCSWDRITAMIPSTIKNYVELIILMGGTNDFASNHPISSGIPEWSSANTTDTDWVAADEYNGGDYDLSTFVGGLMSTIMKMTAWCPNALVVVVAPWGNYNTTTKKQTENGNGNTIMDFALKEKEIAEYLGCPFVDISAEAGVNPFNASSYFSDAYHPNGNGAKLIARVLIGGLRRIPARFDPSF